MQLPTGEALDNAQAVGYARPHLLEIELESTGTPQFKATVRHINAAGPVVKVELATGSGSLLHAEMSPDRYRQLQLRKGMPVFVSVKEMKVFNAPQNMLGGGI